MDELASTVHNRTKIGPRVRQHISVQAIDAWLRDWNAAHERLVRQIDKLTELRRERIEQMERGEWPPPRTT
jgi:hypothetical protein